MDKFIVTPKNEDIKEDRYTTMSLRIEKGLQEKFDKIAQESGRSRNEVIIMALKYALENLEISPKKPSDK